MSLLVRDTMTPINDNSTNDDSVKTKSSSSSLNLNMPSPPLSPYTRNGYDENDNIPTLVFPRASKPLTSDLRYLELYSNNNSNTSTSVNSSASVARPFVQTPYVGVTNKDPIDTTTSPSTVNSPINSSSFEITNANENNNNDDDDDDDSTSLSNNSLLHIEPYKQLNKPGFKKFQLNFLSQYQFNFISPSSSSNFSTSSNTRYNSSRSSTRNVYDSNRSNNPSLNYNSNSDSDLEKPRTRRFVRQNKYELKTVDNSDSVISRPSTPTNKRLTSSPASTPKRQRTSTPVVYNYDYKKIEDFCPLLSTLPSNNKCLKTDWKGQSMDLSNDPLLIELHPAEVTLASILRLPCAVYLDSKRRIFQEKVKRMKYNLPFRRTDAQKSCKIDVNKASRLFASFEKVGWFDEKHFQRFM